MMLPATFYRDHVARGGPGGEIFRVRRGEVGVRLTPDSLRALYDDAAACMSGPESYRVRQSAHATVARLTLNVFAADALGLDA